MQNATSVLPSQDSLVGFLAPRTIRVCALAMLQAVLVAAILGAPVASAEIDDNKGTEFMIGFMENLTQLGSLTIFITGGTATAGTVQIGSLGTPTPFAVIPGTVTSVPVPISARVLGSDVTTDQGIRVATDDGSTEIVVYGLNQRNGSTDAFLGLPVDILATDYIAVGRNENLSTIGFLPRPSEF